MTTVQSETAWKLVPVEATGRIQAFHDPDEAPGNDYYIGVEGDGFVDRAIATRLSDHAASRFVALWNAAASPPPPSTEVGELVERYEFDRYINGVLMAEGVTIERADTLEKAMLKAAKIASRGQHGEVPVLVLRPAAILLQSQAAALAEAKADYNRILDAQAKKIQATITRADSAEAKLKVAVEAAHRVVKAYDECSGAEPSLSVLHREIDIDLREAIATIGGDRG